MHYLFSPDGEAALARFITARTLLAFDFDGTLAPIVPIPDDARAPTSVSLAMTRLSEVARIAIITGRAISDARGRLNFEPHHIVGNHGAEGMPGIEDAHGEHVDVTAWLKQIEAALPSLPKGTQLEYKQHSLTLHYRMAADRDAALLALKAFVDTLEPTPRIIGGKCVINLMPQDGCDKADALLALQKLEQAPNALFVGDDITDDAVFDKKREDWFTIRVGQKDGSAARFYMNSQSEMAMLIQKIDKLIRAQAGGAA